MLLAQSYLARNVDPTSKYLYVSLNKLLIIPPRSRLAKKSTMTGVVLVDKQCGNIHAFRCLDNKAS